MKTKQTIKSLILFALLLFIAVLPAIAQGDFDDAALNDLPIDGGLSVLIAAGIGYGAKKVREKKKNSVS